MDIEHRIKLLEIAATTQRDGNPASVVAAAEAFEAYCLEGTDKVKAPARAGKTAQRSAGNG